MQPADPDDIFIVRDFFMFCADFEESTLKIHKKTLKKFKKPNNASHQGCNRFQIQKI